MGLYLIFSDVHANTAGLDALTDFVQQNLLSEDEFKNLNYRCLGDVVGYGYDPVGAFKKVQALDPDWRTGNHDLSLACLYADMLNHPVYRQMNSLPINVLKRHREILDVGDVEFPALEELEERMVPRVEVVGDFVLVFVHADVVPNNYGYITEYVVTKPDILAKTFKAIQESYAQPDRQTLVFIGHTHIPLLIQQTDDGFQFDGITYTTSSQKDVFVKLDTYAKQPLVMNPGSVGAPRDFQQDNFKYRAYGILLDTDRKTVQYLQAAYDPMPVLDGLFVDIKGKIPDDEYAQLAQLFQSNIFPQNVYEYTSTAFVSKQGNNHGIQKHDEVDKPVIDAVVPPTAIDLPVVEQEVISPSKPVEPPSPVQKSIDTKERVVKQEVAPQPKIKDEPMPKNKPKPSRKSSSGRAWVFILAALAILGVSFALLWGQGSGNSNHTGVPSVFAPSSVVELLADTDIRLEPHPNADIIKKTGESDIWDVLGLSPDGLWYWILLEDGNYGWILHRTATTRFLGERHELPIVQASITPTDVPTNTPVATETPIPTETSTSTETPTPTETSTPTETPTPTETSTPTATPLRPVIELSGQTIVRAEPNSTADIVLEVEAGTELDILGLSPDEVWYWVLLEDGSRGWILARTGTGSLAGPLDRIVAIELTATATLTKTPTSTPTLTETPVPSETPVPTLTPTPTATPLRPVIELSVQTTVLTEPNSMADKLMTLDGGTILDILGQSPDGLWYWVLLEDGSRGWIIARTGTGSLAGPIEQISAIDLTITPTPTVTPTVTPVRTLNQSLVSNNGNFAQVTGDRPIGREFPNTGFEVHLARGDYVHVVGQVRWFDGIWVVIDEGGNLYSLPLENVILPKDAQLSEMWVGQLGQNGANLRREPSTHESTIIEKVDGGIPFYIVDNNVEGQLATIGALSSSIWYEVYGGGYFISIITQIITQ